MPRVSITRRYYITAFVIVCLLFLGVTLRTSDLRRFWIYSDISAQESSVRESFGLRRPAATEGELLQSDLAALQKSIEKGEYIQQDNAVLIRYLRTLISPPSTKPYSISTTQEDTSMGQAAVINKIFNGKKNGFFIECGALDGETRSNTYYFERYLGWQGVLIEGDPSNYALLLNKNRKAYSINVCLSVKDTPIKVVFEQHFNVGKITNLKDQPPSASGYVSVQCFPLYSILLALNRTEVDYFSLDVEGAEMDVLKAIPFDKVNIKTLSVEYFHDSEGEVGVRQFMESKGYVAHSKVNNAQNLANDIIFVKSELIGNQL